MDAEKLFLIYAIGIWLLATFAFCLAIERKGRRMQARIRRAEARKEARLHDIYCTQEAARLYRERRRI